MIMKILCPIHGLPLNISNTTIRYDSPNRYKEVKAITGKCPCCYHFYINQLSLWGEAVYKVGWRNYEFLPLLCDAYPSDTFQRIDDKHQNTKSEKLTLPYSIRLEDIPDSTILVTKIYSRSKCLGTMGIVTDVNDQKQRNGLFWIGRTLPSIVLATIALNKKKRKFSYKGYRYKIANDYQLLKGSEKYFDIISRFCNPESPQIVFVYSHKNISFQDRDEYEMVTAMIPCANSEFPIPIQVYYDKNHKRYWLDEEIYDVTRERYGLPYLRIYTVTNYSSVFKHGFHAFREVSDLRKFGYSVSERDGLTPSDRQQLLQSLVNQGLMWKHQIINHLTMLIKLNSRTPGMVNAIREWREDLKFILNYDADKQRKIWVANFRTQYHQAFQEEQ